MKKRMEITLEIDRVTVVSKRKSPVIWCEGCAALVGMVTVDEAAERERTSSRAIYRRVEAGQLHFAETPEGHLFICLNSISREPADHL